MPTQELMNAEILEWCAANQETHQKARHDLAVRYSVIALALARQNDNPTLLAISAAIDRGNQVASTVAGIVGVSPSAVACLENVNPEMVTDAWVTCPIELFWAMDVLHPLASPQTPEEWGLLRKLWINTGLEEHEIYRTAVGIRRERQIVLEYLFRGLCTHGYSHLTQVLADRLGAMLPGIETDPERIWPFHCYVRFVEMSLPRLVRQRCVGLGTSTEHLLMRYSPTELIRQWESWRCIVAAHGTTGVEVVTGPIDIAKTNWMLNIVVPDFDEVVRWLSYRLM